MFVRLWMTKEPKVLAPTATVAEALRVMTAGNFRRLPVVQGRRLLGLVTEGQLQSLGAAVLEDAVSEHMLKEPVTAYPYMPLEEAVMLLQEHKVGGLPVIYHDHLVGMLTVTDVFRAMTTILAGGEEAVRVTFDMDDDEKAIGRVAELCEKYEIEVLSFVSHLRGVDRGKRMVGIRARGGQIENFVEGLWKNKFRVLQVLVPKEEGADTSAMHSEPAPLPKDQLSLRAQMKDQPDPMIVVGRLVGDCGLELVRFQCASKKDDPSQRVIVLEAKGVGVEDFVAKLEAQGAKCFQVKLSCSATEPVPQP